MGESVIDVKRAAARLGVGEDKVRQYIAHGEFPHAWDAGGATRHFWRIPIEDIDAFIERRRAARVGEPVC